MCGESSIRMNSVVPCGKLNSAPDFAPGARWNQGYRMDEAPDHSRSTIVMLSQTSRRPAPNGRQFDTQFQATLNIIPAYTWYAAPSGALTFVNERCSDYPVLPTDHPLRFGTPNLGARGEHLTML
jgi:hypothetical protein